ncbi:MAG: hypothetical protein ACTHZN_00970 [Canibacter sp.]
MTEQGEQRPLTRRELRERQMRNQQLHVETADEAAALTGEIPSIGQRRHGRGDASGDTAQPDPEELERRAQQYAEIEKQIEIDPVNDDGTPRTRREMRALFQEEFERIFAEREAARAEAEASADEDKGSASGDTSEDAEATVEQPQTPTEDDSTEKVESSQEPPASPTDPSDVDDSDAVAQGAVSGDDVVAEESPDVAAAEVSSSDTADDASSDDSHGEAGTVEETLGDVEDELPPTEALTLEDLFDDSAQGSSATASETASDTEQVERPAPEVDASVEDVETSFDTAAAKAEAAEAAPKGGWLSRLRKKKSVDPEPTEDAGIDVPEAEEVPESPETQTDDDVQDQELPPTEAVGVGAATSFEELLNESVEAEAEAEEAPEPTEVESLESEAESESESDESESVEDEDLSTAKGESITDIEDGIEADDAFVEVQGQTVDVDVEEFEDEAAALTEILPDAEEDTAEAEAEVEDDGDVSDATAPKSASTGGYSFPNIIPLEESQPVFDNTSERDLENSKTGFDNLISRAVEEESSANTSNSTSALILPSMPHSDGISGPIGQTGELFVSGSIELPKSLGETGGHRLSAEALGLDDDQEADGADYTDEHGSTPVSAVRAVSAQNTNYSIVSPEKKDHSKKPMIFALSGGALVLVVGGVIYWGVTNGLFG